MEKVVTSIKNSQYCCWNHCKHHGLDTSTQSKSMALHCLNDGRTHRSYKVKDLGCGVISSTPSSRSTACGGEYVHYIGKKHRCAVLCADSKVSIFQFVAQAAAGGPQ
jgi:hypothetical protein